MNATLVVLAAGIGARYGAGIKQLEPVGPNGELIIDYSVHDAVQSGFDRVIFIIRHDIYDDFYCVIGERLEKSLAPLGIRPEYVFQETGGLPSGRRKPWGTGHALLACRGLLDGPFTVINADDYYGKHAFIQAREFMEDYDQARPGAFGLIGFVLKNTLSGAGGVTRGICAVDGAGCLTKIHETRGIVRTPEGAAVQTEGGLVSIDAEQLVSMNMWMLTPAFVDGLQEGFENFLARLKDPLKDEYLLPEIIDVLIQTGRATVKVLPARDAWFGVTYQEDKNAVIKAFERLTAEGVYPVPLFDDLRRPENRGMIHKVSSQPE